ncbi:aminotransferase class I/II-fold pyridoxal phosphate-dependent enzyme [Parasediminibacterium sp. JCM 36343]|uniref:aminotransferase class I/II-fold pyridoxal phosphate-dependent enzyme n=1 Tax=Parasediminibacterium sp. JCM 36343 TaxID=3374279 RepID=UPI00397BD587
MYNDDFLQNRLLERKQQDAFRVLQLPTGEVDFCSNDYLGLATVDRSPLTVNGQRSTGSAGSRLLAGNYQLVEETETLIADFHNADSALIFNSGYDANLGLLSCVPQKGDTIIYDFLSHASIRDGIRLSQAQSFAFLHNDMNDLERRLKQATGTIFVVTESVFSMDGDYCPLQEIVALCQRYQAHLIIDEAHATGVVGIKGEGLVQSLQLENQVFARVHTFGKACGCHGAVVLGSIDLRNYLINFARSFIYSTALPPHAVAVIKKSYETFPFMEAEREHLSKLINLFQSATIHYPKLVSTTPIQVVIVAGNKEVKQVAQLLQQNNLDVRPILYPTVPKGKERLRIVLHSFNSKEEVQLLVGLLGG